MGTSSLLRGDVDNISMNPINQTDEPRTPEDWAKYYAESTLRLGNDIRALSRQMTLVATRCDELSKELREGEGRKYPPAMMQLMLTGMRKIVSDAFKGYV